MVAKAPAVPGALAVQAAALAHEAQARPDNGTIRGRASPNDVDVRPAPSSADIAGIHALPCAKTAASAGVLLRALVLARRPLGVRAAVPSRVQVRAPVSPLRTPGPPAPPAPTPGNERPRSEPPMVRPGAGATRVERMLAVRPNDARHARTGMPLTPRVTAARAPPGAPTQAGPR